MRIVQKYGGSSLSTLEKVQAAAQRVSQLARQGTQVVVVVSAQGDTTDELIEKAKDVNPRGSAREMDAYLSAGEQLSASLMAMALGAMGVPAVSLCGWQAGLLTDDIYGNARILGLQNDRILRELKKENVVVVAGFQGVNAGGDITTLGRGGSDTTAVALAAFPKADLCQIFTDVDGVYTCDPRVVKDARKISVLSYEEMLEMASSGSKVMQARSVEFAKKFGVVFEVRNSMNNNPGTIVQEETSAMESLAVRGVSIERNQARVTVSGITAPVAYTAIILSALSNAEINVDMIVANTAHDGQARQSFTMNMNDLGAAQAALKSVLPQLGETARMETEAGLAKLSVVGVGMRSHTGVAATMFQALADAGIATGMIATSEIRISTTVEAGDIEQAARVVHSAFHLDQVNA